MAKNIKLSIMGIIFVLLSAILTVGMTMPASAKPVSITITKVACEDPCRNEGLEAAGESAPDFYAKVFINGVEHITTRWPDDQEEVTDPKGIVQDVPNNMAFIPVTIQIWDYDSTSGDDLGDADPNPGDGNLDFTVDMNMNPGKYTGDINSPNNCAKGNGESDKPSVEVCFDIAVPDRDGDGLYDYWEASGVDFNGDGVVDLALNAPPFNANPDHKDIFVEADWMACSAGGCAPGDSHSHAPVANVLSDVVASFAAAPVSNPDGTSGIILHAMQDEALPDRPNILFSSDGSGATDDFNDLKLRNPNPSGPCIGTFGTATDRSSLNCANILGAKKSVFRYMIFGHSYSESPTSSGRAEISPPQGGNDFIVTFGGWSNSNITSGGGQRAVEAGTFMHELGHTLSLQHGGGDGINCKPNYLSVMSYSFQLPNIDINRLLSYSPIALNMLNENALSESSGIGGPAGRLTIYGVGGATRTAQANGPIDWNGDGNIGAGTVSADISRIDAIRCGDDDGNGVQDGLTQLSGYDDWKSIVYNFRNSPFFADGAHGPSPEELTKDDVSRINPLADLKVEKSVDKVDAVGGDTLNYDVKTTNIGPAKAISISLTDTLPNSVPQTRSLPDLDKDGTNTQTFTYALSCTVKEGDTFTNGASITGTNPRGFPDPDLSNNVAQVLTTAHTPKLTLSKTATTSVNAGEAIAYTITYQNTGGGAAANIVITDILPANVYYSKALDLGGGPKPNSVVVNGDGTRTLTWNIASLAANSGIQTIQYTARPSLLFLGGETLTNSVRLTFENANGCKYDPLAAASTSTKISIVPPTKDPLSLGFWRNHPEQQTAEILARVQATDQRYDTDSDGALSSTESAAMLSPGGNQPKVLKMQLLTTYLSLATRRINAITTISSKTADRLGLDNVAKASVYASNTLSLPVNSANRPRYEDITNVLDEVNNNKNEVY